MCLQTDSTVDFRKTDKIEFRLSAEEYQLVREPRADRWLFVKPLWASPAHLRILWHGNLK